MASILLHDTSVLLNLLATSHFEAIAAAIDKQFAICTSVRDEAKSLRDPETGEMVPVDLNPFFQSNALTLLELEGEQEQALYIEQAVVVDDGEAMSLAIASNRSLELAIDDRRARWIASERFPELRLWSTPELLKLWAEQTHCSKVTLSKAILRIEAAARYFPPNTHALASWWYKAKNEERT
jgi:predicted nucleic acid-binding protein